MEIEFSLEDILEFFRWKNGKVFYTDLVTHFKSALSNPETQANARVLFKNYVNTLATVINENGKKYLILRSKYMKQLFPNHNLLSPSSSSSSTTSSTASLRPSPIKEMLSLTLNDRKNHCYNSNKNDQNLDNNNQLEEHKRIVRKKLDSTFSLNGSLNDSINENDEDSRKNHQNYHQRNHHDSLLNNNLKQFRKYSMNSSNQIIGGHCNNNGIINKESFNDKCNGVDFDPNLDHNQHHKNNHYDSLSTSSSLIQIKRSDSSPPKSSSILPTIHEINVSPRPSQLNFQTNLTMEKNNNIEHRLHNFHKDNNNYNSFMKIPISPPNIPPPRPPPRKKNSFSRSSKPLIETPTTSSQSSLSQLRQSPALASITNLSTTSTIAASVLCNGNRNLHEQRQQCSRNLHQQQPPPPPSSLSSSSISNNIPPPLQPSSLSSSSSSSFSSTIDQIEYNNTVKKEIQELSRTPGRVKEHAQILNKLVLDTMPNTSRPSASSINNRIRNNAHSDTDSGSLHLNDPLKKRWMVVASDCDYEEMVMLLKKDPKLSEFCDTIMGYSALHWAAKFNKPEIIKLIAGTFKADPNLKSFTGQTPLHIAAEFKNEDIMKILVYHYGANKEIRDIYGKKPYDYLRKESNSFIGSIDDTNKTCSNEFNSPNNNCTNDSPNEPDLSTKIESTAEYLKNNLRNKISHQSMLVRNRLRNTRAFKRRKSMNEKSKHSKSSLKS